MTGVQTCALPIFRDCFITACLRCPPPANRPTTAERRNCRPWLEAEIELLPRVQVVIALGRLAWDEVLRLHRDRGLPVPSPKPPFAHEAEVRLAPEGPVLLASYHPSQQNTFTRKLTEPMLDRVFARARELVG